MLFRLRHYATVVSGALLLAFLAAACGSPAVPNPVPADDEPNVLSESIEREGQGEIEAKPDQDEAESEATPSNGQVALAGETENRLSVQADLTEVNQAGLQVGFTDDGHPFLGDPNAPIVIQEYSDYQCPFCARFFSDTLPDIVEEQIRQGEAVLVYYDFPLNNIHPQAAAAANAARCAGEQSPSAYWEMHDTLFANPSEWSNSQADTVFASYAEALDLDGEAYTACLDEFRYQEAIQADLATGANLGVSGTPSFFINGQLLVGAQPLAAFNDAIATVKAGGQLASAAPSQEPSPAVAPTPAAIAFGDEAGAIGDPDAPVTIVEFTDFQCPYCSRHSIETLPIIVRELVETGRVYYILKDFPLDQLHPDARTAAAAARCAGESDAYWEMHDEVYARQDEWAGAGSEVQTILSGLGADIGLDAAEILECLRSGRYDQAVQANLDEGLSLGVTGTPSFFINGYPLSGARPYEHFEIATSLAEEGRLAEIYVPSEPEPQQQQQPSGPRDVNIDGAYSIGRPDAPVTIVEFTDFQCPYCSRHFQQTYPQIKEDYVDTGLVRYVFKDFPLNSIHAQAAKAAEAARCAGDQGAYVEMHDLLFANQQVWSGRDPLAVFEDFADQLGLDTEAFGGCLADNTYTAAVEADLQQGISLGVTGTPAFFLNGFPLTGAQPYSVFQQAIDSLLAQENQ